MITLTDGSGRRVPEQVYGLPLNSHSWPTAGADWPELLLGLRSSLPIMPAIETGLSLEQVRNNNWGTGRGWPCLQMGSFRAAKVIGGSKAPWRLWNAEGVGGAAGFSACRSGWVDGLRHGCVGWTGGWMDRPTHGVYKGEW